MFPSSVLHVSHRCVLSFCFAPPLCFRPPSTPGTRMGKNTRLFHYSIYLPSLHFRIGNRLRKLLPEYFFIPFIHKLLSIFTKMENTPYPRRLCECIQKPDSIPNAFPYPKSPFYSFHKCFIRCP